jgi:hypothetical protein
MQKCRVIKQYRTEYPVPLKTVKGEALTIGGRDTQWAGWLWCWSASGKGGWVAEQDLEFASDANGETAVMLCDYDASELDVNLGEILSIRFEKNGWLWCVNASNAEGWLPAENVAEM